MLWGYKIRSLSMQGWVQHCQFTLAMLAQRISEDLWRNNSTTDASLADHRKWEKSPTKLEILQSLSARSTNLMSASYQEWTGYTLRHLLSDKQWVARVESRSGTNSWLSLSSPPLTFPDWYIHTEKLFMTRVAQRKVTLYLCTAVINFQPQLY